MTEKMKQVADLVSGYTGKTKKECRNCPKHGDYIATMTQFSSGWQGGNCPQCYEDSLKSRPAPKIDPRAIIPKRFHNATFDNYQCGDDKRQQLAFATCKRYAERFDDRLEKGGSMILIGKCGTGKTHLSYAIVRAVFEQGNSVKVTKVYDLTSEVKQTWSPNSPTSEHEAIRKYTDPDLLVIDEVGVQFDTQAEKQILFRVLDKRYESMKPVILISNMNMESMTACMTEPVMDRMAENGGSVLVFDWGSHRS
jgi:DNA replication protein DnaC